MPTPKEGWAVRKVNDKGDDKAPPSQRSMKRHPSFETWVAGSPHDSDEYDTDLEEDFNNSKHFNPFTPADRFSLIQNNEWKSLLYVVTQH